MKYKVCVNVQIIKKSQHFMEALVYTFLLIGTLMILFFAVFFRETPRVLKK
jgi:photosystem II PsbT protein